MGGCLRPGACSPQGGDASGQKHPFGDRVVVKLSPFGKEGWEPKGTSGTLLKANPWWGEGGVLLGDGEILRARTPVAVLKESKMPIAPEQVRLWKRLATPAGGSIWLRQSMGWTWWPPPDQVSTTDTEAFAHSLKPDAERQFGCEVQARKAGILKRTDVDAGAVVKSSCGDKKKWRQAIRSELGNL